MARKAGLWTSGEIEAVLLVGPSAPATKQIAAGLRGHDRVRSRPRIPRSGHVQLVGQLLQPVIRQRNGRWS